MYVIRNGLQWKDAPSGYGPPKTLHNRFTRWSRLGVFDRIFAALEGEGPKPGRIMVDATPPQGSSHCGKPAQKAALSRCIGRTKGGLNSKLHAVCDANGKPLILLLGEGQMSDHTGARHILDALSPAKTLLADRGYDSNWFREGLAEKGIEPCIPSTRTRKVPLHYDAVVYRQRHRIENMFAKLKDWRRIATRYDRCAHTFFSAICIFYLNQ